MINGSIHIVTKTEKVRFMMKNCFVNELISSTFTKTVCSGDINYNHSQ